MLKLPKDETSFWNATRKKAKYPKLNKNIEVDVAVVGGGIAGITAAYLLKKSGKTVALLEKDVIGSGGGTTVNTTGKVTSQHNLIYADLVKRLGEKTARLYGQANQTAVGEIEKVIKSEKIDCDFERDDNYVFTRDPQEVSRYKEEARVAKKLGLPASFIIEAPLPFDIEGAVKFVDQAQFHSGKYIDALAKKIDGNGSFIFENTTASGIYDGRPGKVKTKNGTIVAKDIIVATNVPTFPLIARGAYCILEYPQMSYIVASRINRKIKGMYISTDKNEYSILPVTVGKENLLLIGGQNHIPYTKFNKETRYQRLANYAEERFGVKSIDYKWYARDYQAYDDIPLVGKMYPWSKHLYVVTAFKKWGLSNSMASGMILRDLILGEENEWAEVYNPIRWPPIKNIPRVALEYITGN